MSLSRLMLRCLAFNALLPQPGDILPATMAGENVFDSRLDPIEFRKQASDMPAIIVYTDDDTGELESRQANTGPFFRTVELRIELLCGSYDSKANSYGIPMTDSQLEMRLDLFEQQVRWCLLGLPGRSATAAFKSYIIRFLSVASHVQRDESGANRLAARVLIFRVRIPDDCQARWGLQADNPPAMRKLCEADFPHVPVWLRPLLLAMQDDPSVQQVVRTLGGQSAPQIFLPLFRRMRMDFDSIDIANPALLESMHKTQGPDGRIEWSAGVNLNPKDDPPPRGIPGP